MKVDWWRRLIRRREGGSTLSVGFCAGATCVAHALMACGSLTTPDALSLGAMDDGGATSTLDVSSPSRSSLPAANSMMVALPAGAAADDTAKSQPMSDAGSPVVPAQPPESAPPLATCPASPDDRPVYVPPDTRTYPLGQTLGVSFTLAEDPAGFPSPYNACRYDGVYFVARGSGRVRFSAITAETEADPSCLRPEACWDGHSFDLEDDWRPYEMPFVKLTRADAAPEAPLLNLARLTRLSFVQEAEDADGNFWFMLDEIHFLPGRGDARRLTLDRDVVVRAQSTGPGFSPAYVIDRDELSAEAQDAWANASDTPEGRLPQWLEIQLPALRRITLVEVSMAEGLAIKDYDLQTWDGERWVELVAERGNTTAAIKYVVPEVETTRLRVVALAGPDVAPQLARIDELRIEGRDPKLAALVQVGINGRVRDPVPPSVDAGPTEDDAGGRKPDDPTAPCREDPIACVRP